VEVTQAAADASGVPQRLVKILQVKDREAALLGDEIQCLT
jgi:hypothetical protein